MARGPMPLPLLRSVLVVVSVGLSAAQTRDSYCRLSPHHTMCRFTEPAASCGRVLRQHTTAADRQLIVQLHNQLRSRLAGGHETEGAPGPQPAAADMRQLYWDDELARVAQRWADQCRFQHECGECRAVQRFGVGQNLYASISGAAGLMDPDWAEAIAAWYDEVRDFSRHDVDSFPQTDVMIGHYTAVVWARTSRVGCGFTNYIAGGKNTRIYICNYGEGGNVVTLPLYRRGPACSACPAGTGCSGEYPGLCAESGAETQSTPTTGDGPTSTPTQADAPGHMTPPQPPAPMPSHMTTPSQPPAPMPSHMTTPSQPPAPMPGHMTTPVTSSSAAVTPLTPPQPGEMMTPLPHADAVNAYAVRPDPSSGCFRIKDLLICLRSREGVIVLKKA